MERLAMVCGTLLVLLGMVGYLAPATLGTGPGGKEAVSSPTALIPAGIGALLAICGLLVALRPGARKHAMHAAALVALLGAVGGFVPVTRRNFDFSQAAVVLGMLLTAVCVIFVILCVRSFIAARTARSGATPPPAIP